MINFNSDKINAGDKVIVHRSARYRLAYARSVEVIERKTPKGMVIVKGMKYKKDGTEYGGNGSSRLGFWTQDIEDEINAENHRKEVLREIEQTDWSKIQTEKIDRILAILTEGSDENLRK